MAEAGRITEQRLLTLLALLCMGALAGCFIIDPGLDDAPDAAGDSSEDRDAVADDDAPLDDGVTDGAIDSQDAGGERDDGDGPDTFVPVDLLDESIGPGDPCPEEPRDCPPQAPICGPFATCQAGAEGDDCMNATHCGSTSPICGPDSQCHDGSEGDPCGTPGHCRTGLNYCGPDGMCHNGTEGDPCRTNVQCDGVSDCVDGFCD